MLCDGVGTSLKFPPEETFPLDSLQKMLEESRIGVKTTTYDIGENRDRPLHRTRRNALTLDASDINLHHGPPT